MQFPNAFAYQGDLIPNNLYSDILKKESKQNDQLITTPQKSNYINPTQHRSSSNSALNQEKNLSGKKNQSNNSDNLSNYSYAKSVQSTNVYRKENQSEVIIDIHVKYLRLKVNEKTVVRLVWSRGKKQAKTQTKVLSQNLDKAVFDEKFQINTLLEIDPATGMPLKEKIS